MILNQVLQATAHPANKVHSLLNDLRSDQAWAHYDRDVKHSSPGKQEKVTESSSRLIALDPPPAEKGNLWPKATF